MRDWGCFKALTAALWVLVSLAGCSPSDPAASLAANCASQAALSAQVQTVNDATSAASVLSDLADLAACTGDAAAQASALALEAASVIQGRGLLQQALAVMARNAAQTGALVGVDAAKADRIADELSSLINAELCSRGKIATCSGTVYTPWDELSARHLAAVRASSSAVGEPAFQTQIETLSNSSFLSGNSLQLLVDGPASFAVREQLIRGATRSIWLLTWAMYDDSTGQDVASMLADRARAGIDVRVIVDGQVAKRPHYDGTRALRDAGVPVKLWSDPSRPGHGVHLKALIIDGSVVIVGGMNVGDVYAHRGSAETPKWRDTDVVLRGPVAGQAAQVFASLWGDGVLTAPSPGSIASAGSTQAAFTAQMPTGPAYIQLATLKAIESARTTVDIENAYFIKTPDLDAALRAALARGVRVRIFTNSAESIDEPVVTQPILGSLPELLELGAEVYLRRGSTLHSKFMIVDGQYAWIGSFNLHPRSVRYEGEDILQVLDSGFAASLTAVFENDLKLATRVLRIQDLGIPDSALGTLAERFFFDQL